MLELRRSQTPPTHSARSVIRVQHVRPVRGPFLTPINQWNRRPPRSEPVRRIQSHAKSLGVSSGRRESVPTVPARRRHRSRLRRIRPGRSRRVPSRRTSHRSCIRTVRGTRCACVFVLRSPPVDLIVSSLFVVCKRSVGLPDREPWPKTRCTRELPT